LNYARQNEQNLAFSYINNLNTRFLNSMSLKSLSNIFIKKIQRDNRICLIPFSESEWFRGAYSTIQRTLHDGYIPLESQQKEACQRYVNMGLLALRAHDFDCGLKQLILGIAKNYHLSIGHSQKLVSILSKYAFCVYYADRNCIPKDWSKFIESCETKLPVPVDAFVLHALQHKFTAEFPDVKSYQSKNSKTGKSSTSAYVRVGTQWIPWSRLDDYDVYWSLQTRIRKLTERFIIDTSIEFEMRWLWTTTESIKSNLPALNDDAFYNKLAVTEALRSSKKHNIELTWTDVRSFKKIHLPGELSNNLGYITEQKCRVWITVYDELNTLLPHGVLIEQMIGFEPKLKKGGSKSFKGSIPFPNIQAAKRWLHQYFHVKDNPPLP